MTDADRDLARAAFYRSVRIELTAQQKLAALAARFYSFVKWEPKAGDGIAHALAKAGRMLEDDYHRLYGGGEYGRSRDSCRS